MSVPLSRLATVTLTLAMAAVGAGCTRSAAPAAHGPAPRPISTSPSALPTPAAPPLRWATCSGGFECAKLAVPLDHTHPQGRTVELALVRARATDPGARIGSLLINPGGPGESGVTSFPSLLKQLSTGLRARFDVVGFDPRGVGRSAPVRCLDAPELDRLIGLDPAPSTPAGLQALFAGARKLAAGCQQRSGDLLPFVGTVDAARDIDAIRAAVGDERTTYLGFSYGTLLGATYADLFPTRVRALALDGALDPTLSPFAVGASQADGFERSLGAFFADCTGRADCGWRPPGGMAADVRRLLADDAAHPLPTGLAGRLLQPGDALLGLLSPLYQRRAWPVLAKALADADHGDGTTLLRLSDGYAQRQPDGSYSNLIEVNNAVTCRDETWPTDVAAYQRAADEAARRDPLLGAAVAFGPLSCAYWPVRGDSSPHPLVAPGSAPILVVGTTGDPATPYQEAQALASQLEHGVLLTRVGEGHTGYGASSCVQAAVDAYLVVGKVPPVGTRCDP